MLGYAVETRVIQRKPAPATLALIIVGHAALILAVMSAKMTLPERLRDPPIIIDSIDLPKDPPPPEATPQPRSSPVETRIDQVPIIVPTPGLSDALPLDRGPPTLLPPFGKTLLRCWPPEAIWGLICQRTARRSGFVGLRKTSMCS